MLLMQLVPLFRLCGVVHVLFHTFHYFLNDGDTGTTDSEEFEIPEHVSEETAQSVLELVRYFSKQRAILNMVRAVIVWCRRLLLQYHFTSKSNI